MKVYTHLSDDEMAHLYRDHDDPLIKELARRLEATMRQKASSVFDDQAAFMLACGQTVAGQNVRQAHLYWSLIQEEMHELQASKSDVEGFDAVLDLIVVLIGFGLSNGWPMQDGWDEVVRSNMAKVDPVTGQVRRRDDGKILKPEGWTPPDLGSLIHG